MIMYFRTVCSISVISCVYTGDMYVVRESIDLSDESDDDSILANSEPRFHAMIIQVDMGKDNFKFNDTCPSEQQFEGTSKGFEGAVSLRGVDNTLYILVSRFKQDISKIYQDITSRLLHIGSM